MRRILRTVIAAMALLLLPLVASLAQLPPQPAECAQAAPVCALKDGSRQTYWNACLAGRDGAQFLNVGECRGSRSYGMNRKSPGLTRF
jgi:hypothetical protein